MHRTLSNKIIKAFCIILILITCASCKKVDTYTRKEYLSLLSDKAGLSNEDDKISNLIVWGVVKQEELDKLYLSLDYKYLSITIGRLLDIESNYLNELKNISIIQKNKKENNLVSKRETNEIIDKAIDIINNQTFISSYEYKEKEKIKDVKDIEQYDGTILKSFDEYEVGDILLIDGDYKIVKEIKEDGYILKNASVNEVFEDINIEDSYEIDFNEAIDIPGGDLVDERQVYQNLNRQLLSSSNSKVFYNDGFRISYSFKSNGIDIHISKNIKGVNVFYDLALSDVKPSYKWDYKEGKLKAAYFKVAYQTTSELGVSVGRYNNYYLDFKELDAKNFFNSIKSIIKPQDDKVEASIRICEVKTPIPNIPSAYFNIEVVVKIYTSGKAEVVLANRRENGFEIKNGLLRTINENDADVDFILGGSAKALIGINFNLEAINNRLMDFEIDGGIKANVKSTFHLYDDEGEEEIIQSELPYSSLDEIAKENNNVKICGDISLNWVLDLNFNTSKTLLNKFGLSKNLNILDTANQIFGNKTHIENGILMNSCTRKKQLKKIKDNSITQNVEKIILEKYAAVLYVGDTYDIPIKEIPNGYSYNDIVLKSSDNNVVGVNKGQIIAKKMGSCEVKIMTNDQKYEASINILVSKK